jgi:hypothetical protein
LAVDDPVVVNDAAILPLLAREQPNQPLLLRLPLPLLPRLGLPPPQRVLLPRRLALLGPACEVGGRAVLGDLGVAQLPNLLDVLLGVRLSLQDADLVVQPIVNALLLLHV